MATAVGCNASKSTHGDSITARLRVEYRNIRKIYRVIELTMTAYNITRLWRAKSHKSALSDIPKPTSYNVNTHSFISNLYKILEFTIIKLRFHLCKYVAIINHILVKYFFNHFYFLNIIETMLLQSIKNFCKNKNKVFIRNNIFNNC